MKTRYLKHTIRKFGNNGESIFLAYYVSCIAENAVETDIVNHFSHLRPYFALFGLSQEKVRDYIHKHPTRAEELLGGMSSSLHYLLQTGDWLPIDPPPTEQIEFTPKTTPVFDENGIKLWLLDN
jgi:hypothetical protein